MQGKSTHATKDQRRFHIVSTGKVAVYNVDDAGNRRLFAIVIGERLLSVPGGSTAFEFVPDRKVEYEAYPLGSPSLREKPDPTPVELGIPRPLSLQDEMRRFIREEIISRDMEGKPITMEEEDDFDVDEDPDLTSDYELSDMQEEEGIEGYSLDDEEAPPSPSKPEPPAPEEPTEGPASPE